MRSCRRRRVFYGRTARTSMACTKARAGAVATWHAHDRPTQYRQLKGELVGGSVWPPQGRAGQGGVNPAYGRRPSVHQSASRSAGAGLWTVGTPRHLRTESTTRPSSRRERRPCSTTNELGFRDLPRGLSTANEVLTWGIHPNATVQPRMQAAPTVAPIRNLRSHCVSCPGDLPESAGGRPDPTTHA